MLSIGSAARADPAEPALDFVVNIARRMDSPIEVLHHAPADAKRRLDNRSCLRTDYARPKVCVNTGVSGQTRMRANTILIYIKSQNKKPG